MEQALIIAEAERVAQTSSRVKLREALLAWRAALADWRLAIAIYPITSPQYRAAFHAHARAREHLGNCFEWHYVGRLL